VGTGTKAVGPAPSAPAQASSPQSAPAAPPRNGGPAAAPAPQATTRQAAQPAQQAPTQQAPTQQAPTQQAPTQQARAPQGGQQAAPAKQPVSAKGKGNDEEWWTE
jgi:hypothetical protein